MRFGFVLSSLCKNDPRNHTKRAEPYPLRVFRGSFYYKKHNPSNRSEGYMLVTDSSQVGLASQRSKAPSPLRSAGVLTLPPTQGLRLVTHACGSQLFIHDQKC